MNGLKRMMCVGFLAAVPWAVAYMAETERTKVVTASQTAQCSRGPICSAHARADEARLRYIRGWNACRSFVLRVCDHMVRHCWLLRLLEPARFRSRRPRVPIRRPRQVGENPTDVRL